MGYTVKERRMDIVLGMGVCTCADDQLEEDLYSLFTDNSQWRRVICHSCQVKSDILFNGISGEWALTRLARDTRRMEREDSNRGIQTFRVSWLPRI